MRWALPEPNSLLLLALLEATVAVLRFLHRQLDPNREDGGLASAYGLQLEINELNAQGKFADACLKEIFGLFPVVRPLAWNKCLQLWHQNKRKSEAIGIGVMGGF